MPAPTPAAAPPSPPNWPALDPYIVDTLMRDLAGHDQRPSAFLLYLWLWRNTQSNLDAGLRISLQKLSTQTGLSRSTVQQCLDHLDERKLLTIQRSSPTAVPLLTVQRPWSRRSSR